MYTVALGPSTLIDVCGYAAIECRAITNREGENVQIQALLLEKLPAQMRYFLQYEYEMYADLHCPHMLELLSVQLIEPMCLLTIETKMCYGITLTNLMQFYRQAAINIPEEFIWFIFANILELLLDLHDFTNRSGIKRYCHFLCPSNIFLTVDGEVRVFPATESLSSLIGCASYAGLDIMPCLAPELSDASPKSVTPESEIWSLGKLLLDMCLLFLSNDPDMPSCNARDNPGWTSKCGDVPRNTSSCSLLLAVIINRCMSLDPQSRPRAEELFRFLPQNSMLPVHQMLSQVFGSTDFLRT